MGFPYEGGTWDGVSGPIFMGYGTSMPGLFTVLAIIVCIAALVIGQGKEAAKYRNYK